MEAVLATTRVFKSGNSQAVRIPAELAYIDRMQDLTIQRNGDVITILPARLSLRAAVAKLRDMPTPPEAETREAIVVPDRPGL